MERQIIKPCHVTEMISAFIDGELSHKDKQLVDQHLKDCAVCRKEYDTLKSVDNLLCNINPIEPSSGFNRRFWEEVDVQAAKKKPWSIFKDFSWGWHPSLVSAAAVMLIVTGSFMAYRLMPPELDSFGLDPTDQLIAQNMTLYSNYEIIKNLELLENWDEIMNLEEQIN
jgi:putative zinc finger protein